MIPRGAPCWGQEPGSLRGGSGRGGADLEPPCRPLEVTRTARRAPRPALCQSVDPGAGGWRCRRCCRSGLRLRRGRLPRCRPWRGARRGQAGLGGAGRPSSTPPAGSDGPPRPHGAAGGLGADLECPGRAEPQRSRSPTATTPSASPGPGGPGPRWVRVQDGVRHGAGMALACVDSLTPARNRRHLTLTITLLNLRGPDTPNIPHPLTKNKKQKNRKTAALAD